MKLPLLPHPSTPFAAALTVDVARDATTLRLEYVLQADLDRLLIAPAGAVRLGSDLFRHTCCEAFIGLADGAAYDELNFSPSRQWAMHRFRAYRDGGPVEAPEWSPTLEVRTQGDTLTLRAGVPLAALSPAFPTAPLRLALSAVLEARDGTLSYWALRHPAGRPDFHHHASFAVTLEPPVGG
ncbi:MAG: DOMON-like domain-containing protein [Deltaproteobacteria bacterium]|nr:DOMON-like domain-containing protein [Deltaproteobacteria bacterium]